LSPGAGVDVVTPPPPAVDPIDITALARSVQGELKRLGCYNGEPDGVWGTGSRAAVDKAIQLASLSAPAGTPADDAAGYQKLLDALAPKQDRLCPLECGARFTASNGQCVLKSCPKGQALDKAGTCRAKPKVSSAPRAKSGGGGGGNCFTFNGKRECE
jgi:peptidoglycan hydrolase-like protein with peptidoglycan-binding domain